MAKKRLFLFLALVVCLCACRKQDKPFSVSKDAYYEKAVNFVDQHNDSAYYYFNKFVSTSKDNLQIARAYNYMAVIQYEAGDYFGAQEILTQSLKFLDEQNEKHYGCLSSDYNELGLTYMKLKNFDAALPLYDLALKYATKESSRRSYLNNKALTLNRKKDYSGALSLYRSILSQPMQTRKEYARTLSNMAIVNWRIHPDYIVAPILFKALEIRKSEKDNWGQNASYDHLSEYYMYSRPDSALFYAQAMYKEAQFLDSPDDLLEALQKLIKLSAAGLSKQYFISYQQLADSVQTARNSAKNQFALIRYDTEKRKADNVMLQYELFKRNILLVGLVSAFLIIIGAGLFWYRKRQQSVALATRERELRLSQKVHDGVANGLYRMMKRIENQKVLEAGPLLDEIEILYEQSRDISYEQPESVKLEFSKKIKELLTGFCGPAVNLAIVGNKPELWIEISKNIKRELEYVLQELMVNMSKHSGATSASVVFKRLTEGLEVIYTDNGIGLPPSINFGNGLRNTENRIIGIGGVVTFDNKSDKGTRIILSIPLL